jgi:hypothetical protein
MLDKKYFQNSIAIKLLKVVFSIYFVVTFFITAFHIYLEYENSKKYVTSNINTIIESFEEPMSKAIWAYNQHQIEFLSDGILKLKVISHMEIYNEHNEIILKKENIEKKDYFQFKKKLYFTDLSAKHYVGYILVYYKKDMIF